MGNLIFWILHLMMFLFFIPGLVITIPLHLIFSRQGSKGGPAHG